MQAIFEIGSFLTTAQGMVDMLTKLGTKCEDIALSLSWQHHRHSRVVDSEFAANLAVEETDEADARCM